MEALQSRYNSPRGENDSLQETALWTPGRLWRRWIPWQHSSRALPSGFSAVVGDEWHGFLELLQAVELTRGLTSQLHTITRSHDHRNLFFRVHLAMWFMVFVFELVIRDVNTQVLRLSSVILWCKFLLNFVSVWREVTNNLITRKIGKIAFTAKLTAIWKISLNC